VKKLLFLINPLSGSGKGVMLAGKIADALQGRLSAQEYNIVFTTPDVTAQARSLARQYESIVAVGGDGTLNRVARVLIELTEPPKLGIIPLGTGNDCARALGILAARKRGGLGAMIDVILAGTTRPVDVFTLGEQHIFISYAGFGRDAAIATAFDTMRRKALFRMLCSCGCSKLLYFLLGLVCAGKSCAPGLEIRYHKEHGFTETLRLQPSLCQLLISNITSYGGGACVSSKTRMDDGKFEVVIMRDSIRWLLLHLSRFTGGAYDGLAPADAVFQARELSLRLPDAVPAQIDGETITVGQGERLNIRLAGQLMMIADAPPQ
jgi:diacylglycerol kinase (ATP)